MALVPLVALRSCVLTCRADLRSQGQPRSREEEAGEVPVLPGLLWVSVGLCWMCLSPRALLSLVPARSYVVVSPAVLYHPHHATLWVHLSDLQGPVQIHVQLQSDKGTLPTTLLKREVLEPHLHLNVTFPVSVTPMSAQGSREPGGAALAGLQAVSISSTRGWEQM